jgi:imidazolonepropionase-like amidohydrolase
MTSSAKITLLLLFGATILSLVCISVAYPQSEILISGGTLIDVRTGKEIKNSQILIQDDRIKNVSGAGEIRVTKNTQQIDATGKWIVPGLMDMHSHVTSLSDVPFEMYLAKGVTTIRDPGSDVTQSRLLRTDLDSGKKLGPRYYFAGQILDGIPPVWPGGTILVDTPERARSAVNFLIDQGVDFVKVYNNVKEPELIEIIKTAHNRGVRVAGHVPRTLTMTHVVELGMDCLEHIRITGRELLSPEEADRLDFLPYAKREILLWQSFDLNSEKMRALIAFLAQKKVFMDVTLIIAHQLTFDPENEISDPDNQFLREDVFERWKKEPIAELYKVPPELKLQSVTSFKKMQQFVGMCYRAGVQIITGTDGPGLGDELPGFALHHEFQMLSESGMKPLDVLRAATLVSAEALGKEKDLGTIEAGKYADLLILKKNPAEDVKNLDSIETVIKGGLVLDPKELIKSRKSQK